MHVIVCMYIFVWIVNNISTIALTCICSTINMSSGTFLSSQTNMKICKESVKASCKEEGNRKEITMRRSQWPLEIVMWPRHLTTSKETVRFRASLIFTSEFLPWSMGCQQLQSNTAVPRHRCHRQTRIFQDVILPEAGGAQTRVTRPKGDGVRGFFWIQADCRYAQLQTSSICLRLHLLPALATTGTSEPPVWVRPRKDLW